MLRVSVELKMLTITRTTRGPVCFFRSAPLRFLHLPRRPVSLPFTLLLTLALIHVFCITFAAVHALPRAYVQDEVCSTTNETLRLNVLFFKCENLLFDYLV